MGSGARAEVDADEEDEDKKVVVEDLTLETVGTIPRLLLEFELPPIAPPVIKLADDDAESSADPTVVAGPIAAPDTPAVAPAPSASVDIVRSNEVGPGRTGASLGLTDRLMAEWGTKAPGVLYGYMDLSEKIF